MTPSIDSLCGKRVLLGISAGIAAYKTPDLVRKLRQAGAEVQVALTADAKQFVAPMALQAVTGSAPYCELFDSDAPDAMRHISLARWADLLLVAPATADLMARLADGRAKDLLTATCLACDAPRLLAPAMNAVMWQNPATQSNSTRLQEQGWQLAGPGDGDQACGDQGLGRMLEPQELVDRAAQLFTTGSLAGKQVLVSAGPTHEKLDPVRFIGNRSSGRMGFALAQAAAEAGAQVQLVAGPVHLPTPQGVRRTDVVNALQMRDAVVRLAPEMDVFVACAAVADYRPAQASEQKIKRAKAGDDLELRLTANPDIVAQVAALAEGPFILAFAAETEDLLGNAERKLAGKGVDMLAANDVSQPDSGIEAADNAITLLRAGGAAPEQLGRASKEQLARTLVERLAAALATGAGDKK